MDSDISQKRIDAFKKAPQQIQDMYGNPETGGKIKEIGERLHLTEEAMVALARCFGDVLLGFIPRNDFVDVIQKTILVPRAQAEFINEELSPFLDTAFTPKEPAASSPSETIENEPTDSNAPELATEQETKPITREDILKALNATRTMSSDTASLQKKDPQ